MFGYDQICNGSTIAMPSFLMYFGNTGPSGLYLPSIWTSLWTSMTSLLQALGAISVGMVSDRFGRKWPGVVAGIISLAGTAVIYYAKSRGTLLAGKMVCGLALGAGMAIGTTYASEVSPVCWMLVFLTGSFLILGTGCTFETPQSYPDGAGALYRLHAGPGAWGCEDLCP